MYKLSRVIISGGGTGGHIFPAIAIANAIKLKNPDAEILFVGAMGKMEMEKVPKAGYEIVGLPIAGLQRRLSAKNLALPFKMLKSLSKARQLIKTFKPEVAIGVGGYASVPLLFAAQQLGVKTFIQEQNAFAGLSNKWLGKKARVVFCAYPNMERFFGNKVIITGNPVRQDVLNHVFRDYALKHFGFEDKKTILFVGGSLGARCLNVWLTTNYLALLDQGYQIIWQTGAGYFKSHPEMAENSNPSLRITPFIDQMSMAYAAADVVVSRAGALAISEIAALHKPSILVPSPFVAEDHQTKNAEVLAKAHAAVLVPEAELDALLKSAISNLLGNEETRREMAENLIPFAKENAASDIVDHIEKELNS